MTALNMDKLWEERKREEAHPLRSCMWGSVLWSHDHLGADADWWSCVKQTGVWLTGWSDTLDYVSLKTRVSFLPEWNSFSVVTSKRFTLKLNKQNRANNRKLDIRRSLLVMLRNVLINYIYLYIRVYNAFRKSVFFLLYFIIKQKNNDHRSQVIHKQIQHYPYLYCQNKHKIINK